MLWKTIWRQWYYNSHKALWLLDFQLGSLGYFIYLYMWFPPLPREKSQVCQLTFLANKVLQVFWLVVIQYKFYSLFERPFGKIYCTSKKSQTNIYCWILEELYQIFGFMRVTEKIAAVAFSFHCQLKLFRRHYSGHPWGCFQKERNCPELEWQNMGWRL